jgi:hypothetical protein
MHTPVLSQPLNELQMELLELFARQISDEELMEIKTMLSNYFAEKAMKEMEQEWKGKGYTQETEKQWLSEHLRTPYQR